MKRTYVKNATKLIEANRELLGTMPDRQLAEQLGVSVGSVSNYRRKSGIKASRRYSSSSKAKSSGRSPSKVAAFHAQVGTVADREIAEIAGVSVAAVQQYRRKHNIPAARRGGKKKAAGPDRTTRAAGKRRYVWKILGVEQDLFIVASSLAEAAAHAESANHHGGIQRVGIALT